MTRTQADIATSSPLDGLGQGFTRGLLPPRHGGPLAVYGCEGPATRVARPDVLHQFGFTFGFRQVQLEYTRRCRSVSITDGLRLGSYSSGIGILTEVVGVVVGFSYGQVRRVNIRVAIVLIAKSSYVFHC